MRLYAAACAVLEAGARLLNEKANTLEFGVYARGLKDGRQDAMNEFGIEVEYMPVGDDEDDEDE